MLKNKGSLLIEVLFSLQIYLLIIFIISHLYTVYINTLKDISYQYIELSDKEGEFILTQLY